ncbi:hypothetical protein, partial [Streptococcus oralis]
LGVVDYKSSLTQFQ